MHANVKLGYEIKKTKNKEKNGLQISIHVLEVLADHIDT
jgi:hypothetical protein